VVITGNVSRPFLCSEGRYVIGSNQAGALNEAFSDVFGTSVELFYHPRGEGLLRGDYALGEDVEGFGPIRSLSNPGAIHAAGDTGPLPFPDHFSRHLSYALVLLQGTQANPIVVDFAPLAFVNGSPIPMFKTGSDFGGVHFNATVLGHAFYLAVEGGRNGTSGVTVSGVGDANRALIERAFFRAMTELLPNSPSMATAAQAIYQSSVDLYGASSAPANAIRQALMAVGF
jgi:Zn-dependent metalloprotease